MLKKQTSTLPEFLAGDHTLLKEILHPKKDPTDLPYSLAHARLESGQRSLPHRLRKSTEVYYFLGGRGTISINGQNTEVEKSDVILVPPDAEQFLENRGDRDLEFLCIVSPPWKESEEEIF